MNKNTTLIIDGGLGRVITAIPALEKFVQNNPDSTILISGWYGIVLGNKILTNNVFDMHSKGIFERIKNTKIIKPEPYYNSNYLNGAISLIDAWHEEINDSKEKLPRPSIYLSDKETSSMSFIRNNYYSKIIAFQPFGSSAVITENGVTDTTYRSLTVDAAQYLIKLLRKEGYGIWLMTDRPIPFFDRNNFINAGSNDIRETAGLLYHCDYFLGIDSSGQHVARAFDIPGTVIMGGTNTINVTYPDFFNVLNDQDKTYMPYRLADFDWYLSELENHDIMKFNSKQLSDMGKSILKHIKTFKNKKIMRS